MNLPLSDQEREALADFLNEAIADGLYPLSLKLRPIRSVLAKLERSGPKPTRSPLSEVPVEGRLEPFNSGVSARPLSR
jgi:hypothetical protein